MWRTYEKVCRESEKKKETESEQRLQKRFSEDRKAESRDLTQESCYKPISGDRQTDNRALVSEDGWGEGW